MYTARTVRSTRRLNTTQSRTRETSLRLAGWCLHLQATFSHQRRWMEDNTSLDAHTDALLSRSGWTLTRGWRVRVWQGLVHIGPFEALGRLTSDGDDAPTGKAARSLRGKAIATIGREPHFREMPYPPGWARIVSALFALLALALSLAATAVVLPVFLYAWILALPVVTITRLALRIWAARLQKSARKATP